MAVLSKAIKFSLLAAVVAAAPHKGGKKRGHKIRNLAFLAPAALTSAAVTPALRAKHAENQDELTRFVFDAGAMLESFEAFMTRRYGQVNCEVECDDFRLATSTDPPKDFAKFNNFQDNVKKAYERNQESDEVVHGITSVMDLNAEEFTRLLGYKPVESSKTIVEKTAEAKAVLGEEAFNAELEMQDSNGKKDWRDEGAITPVKDQGHCGSCWAFSTVESIESAAIIAGKSDPKNPFIGSPAQLVDCDKGDMGCQGGLPSTAFKYLKTHPLEQESDYPYKPIGERCTAEKSKGDYEVTKDKALSIWGIGEKHMKNYLVKTGPISIGVAANSAWQTYKGGVMDNDVCPDAQPNHAVQAVAVDADSDQPTWTIRNSWAEDWGEDGFIRITYGKNTCNIAFSGYGVQVKKVADDDTMAV